MHAGCYILSRRLTRLTTERAEAADGLPGMQVRNLAKLKAALEAGGVIFIDSDAHGGHGVRLKC